MALISCYFQVHQPYRLRDLRITDLHEPDLQYFDDRANETIFRKVAEKCYLPANTLLLKLLKKNPDFRVAFSLSGVFLEQCNEYGPDVLTSFQQLVKTGQVELMAETYYHSLSSVLSLEEFCKQVQLHVETIQKLFGVMPQVFRNTELIYSNHIAEIVRNLGFKGILTEGVDHILDGRSPNVPYSVPSFSLSDAEQAVVDAHRIHFDTVDTMQVLLKNYRLSDDIAFRFSSPTWQHYPLSADTYTSWLQENDGHSVNLFMDYETFGEHQWADTGIFAFLEQLPNLWKQRRLQVATPSEVLRRWEKTEHEEYDVHSIISWADMERDLSAWRGNQIQDAALQGLYDMEADIKASGDEQLLTDWRRLQTSDHFYYMCTKFWADGDVHKYFSPYDSPYEAYRRFSHALWHMQSRLEYGRVPAVADSTHSQSDELRIMNNELPKHSSFITHHS